MELRYIGLMLNVDEYPRIYRSAFLFRERYIGNFLGRRVKPLKFKTEKYNALIMNGQHTPAERCSIVPEKSLSAPVYFDQVRYDSLGPNEHHEFFLGMYIEGIEKANRDFPIPYDVLMQSIEDFRQGGYKNEWVDKRKLHRPLGLHATLLCYMDTNRFQLTLLLERKGKTIYREPILTTLPDEIMYKGDFKELVVEGTKILIMEEYGKVTFSLDVSTLE